MIELVRIGRPTERPSLVAVPGIDGSIGSVEPIVRALAGDRQVVVVDYTKEENPTLEALSAEIAGIVDDGVEGTIDIIGQSIGTIAAAQVASRHLTTRVRRTVLMCTFTDLTDWRLRVGNFSLRLTPDWLYRRMAPLTMAYVCGPVGDGDDHPFFAAARQSSRKGVMKRTAWQIGRDFSDDIAAVPQPLLVLMGARDRFVPDLQREIEKLRTLLADRPASVVSVPDGGHVLLDSGAVDTAVAEIERFLETAAADN
jgi:pimeloyl-ACP methyl ester carboxylesterase